MQDGGTARATFTQEDAGVHAKATINVAIGELTIDNTSDAVVLSDATGKTIVDNKLTAYIYVFPEDVSGTNNLTLTAKNAADKPYEVKFDGYSITAGKVYKKEVTFTEAIPAVVYVAGKEANADNKDVAILWTNGVETKLSDGTTNAEANSVYVSGSDVYVVGAVNSETIGTNRYS